VHIRLGGHIGTTYRFSEVQKDRKEVQLDRPSVCAWRIAETRDETEAHSLFGQEDGVGCKRKPSAERRDGFTVLVA
jgi:hypothetical protein